MRAVRLAGPITILVLVCLAGTALAQTPILTGQPPFSHFECLPDDVTYPEPTSLPCTDITPGELMEFLDRKNPGFDRNEFGELARTYRRWGRRYGVRWEYAFFQMLKETGYLKFNRDDSACATPPCGVQTTDYNFNGVGATVEGEGGMRFADVDAGVRAHLLHLLLYAGVDVPAEEFTNDVGPRWRGAACMGRSPEGPNGPCSYSRDMARSTIRGHACRKGRPLHFEDLGALYAQQGGQQEAAYGNRILDVANRFCTERDAQAGTNVNLAGSYWAAHGPVCCRGRGKTIECGYAKGQLLLERSADGKKLVGSWLDAYGKRGPVEFNVAENGELAGGHWRAAGRPVDNGWVIHKKTSGDWTCKDKCSDVCVEWKCGPTGSGCIRLGNACEGDVVPKDICGKGCPKSTCP